MDTNQMKITKLSKKITLLLRLAFIGCGIIMLLALLAMGILLLSGDGLRASFIAAFDITANNGTTISIPPRSLLILFAFMLIDTMLIAALLSVVHSIFHDMGKGNTPFTRRNAARIKGIAGITVILSLLGSYSDALVDYYTIGELAWRANVIGLITGAILYCISFIFGYGCELQQESDETL